MSGRFQPTAAEVSLLAELKLSPRLEDYPHTILRLAQLIADLQENSGVSAARGIARKLRAAVETKR